MVTDFRRDRDQDTPELADADPVVMRVLVHLEKAMQLPPSEARAEWDWAHKAISDFRFHLEHERPPEPHEVWDFSLAEIGVEVRIINTLELELLIGKVSDLLRCSRGQLLAINGMSHKNLAMLVNRLQSIKPLLLHEVNRRRMEEQVDHDWLWQLRHGEWPPIQTA